jgi:hypothetical protein
MAEKRGFTLFGMLNDLLDLAIKADSMGISLKEAVDSFELAKEVRDASFTLVLESLLYETAEIAFRSEKEKALQTWFDAGVWIAQRYIARGVDDPLGAYERELKVFGWNIPGVTMERSDKEVSFRILSPRFSETYTLLFNHYLQGIIDGSGYTVTFNEVGRGNIRLEAVKREDNGGHR